MPGSWRLRVDRRASSALNRTASEGVLRIAEPGYGVTARHGGLRQVNDKTAGSSAQAEYERRSARHAADVRRRRPRILALASLVAIVGLVVLTVTPSRAHWCLSSRLAGDEGA
jgi:hypothetical protein